MTANRLNKKAESAPRQDQNKSLVIFGYTNYRTYLKDFYDFKKSGPRSYSFRTFSKAAGFSSPNILKLVMSGQRNIGSEAIPKFIKGLGLEGAMARYFETLVAMNQATLDHEKEGHFEILKRLTPHSKRRDLNAEGLKYLSHWLHPTIREMIAFPDFIDDPYWIARRLTQQATIAEIGRALKFLLEENFIEKRDGRYTSGDQMILSSDEVRSLAIRNYHRQMLDLAKESLETLALDQREFGALTLMLPESAISELKFKIKQFRKDLHEWGLYVSSDQPSDMVVQVNAQMFPLTRKVGLA